MTAIYSGDSVTFTDTSVQATASDSGIKPIAASVASSALTVTLSPTPLQFRSATLSSGTVTASTILTAISLVVPSTATLGTISATQSRLVVLAINNAGTVELAIVNISGGNNLDETTLITTTAISTSATANNVIYSTTARTSVAFRVVGYVESTQATAGTWATAPSTVQGQGGNALAAMSSLGYGQAWQIVTRTSGTTYYNTTGKPIVLRCLFDVSTGASFTVNGLSMQVATTDASTRIGGLIEIPPYASYSITGTQYIPASNTAELR